MKRIIQHLCLWLFFDSNIQLGCFAPYVLGLGIGRMPHKVKDK